MAVSQLSRSGCSSFALPFALGGLITHSWKGAVTGLIWGGLVRLFFNHHITWSVNSICHFFGRRPFTAADHSTNNWVLALPSLGESWHHNHHVFPTSAFHGLSVGAVRPLGPVIAGGRRWGWCATFAGRRPSRSGASWRPSRAAPRQPGELRPTARGAMLSPWTAT